MYYTQCKLQLDCGCFEVAWIPSKFAILGKILKIKEDDKTWSNGWVVKEVYSTKTEEEVVSRERDFKLFFARHLDEMKDEK